MDLFPDGLHVRLRSRGRDGMYLHADEDGEGVYLSPSGESLHAVWLVHRVEREGDTFLLLHGAAYGRYVAATLDRAPHGHIGYRVVQGVYDHLRVASLGPSPRRRAFASLTNLATFTEFGSLIQHCAHLLIQCFLQVRNQSGPE